MDEEPSCPNFSLSMLPIFTEGEIGKVPLTPPMQSAEDKFDPILQVDPSEIKKLFNKEGNPKVLGRGTFGTVYKCSYEQEDEDEEIVAVKEISFQNLQEETIAIIEKEVKIVKYLSHPLIIKVFGYFLDKENKSISIVQEFMDGGSLDGYLDKKGKELMDFEKWHLVKTLIKSINFLHSKNVVHRDIKPQNYLMSADRKRIVMTDFGMATIKKTSQVERSTDGMAGTARYFFNKFLLKFARYIAPEGIGKYPVYTKKSDVFSLGMTIYHIVTGRVPFFEEEDQLVVIFNIGNKERPKLPSETPREFKEVISMCLEYLPENRPTTHELLEYMKRHEEKFFETHWLIPEISIPSSFKKKKKPLEAFLCPLRKEVFTDPVMLIQNGRTYERKAIEEWIAENGTDPESGTQLTETKIIRNKCVLDCIVDYFKD